MKTNLTTTLKKLPKNRKNSDRIAATIDLTGSEANALRKVLLFITKIV